MNQSFLGDSYDLVKRFFCFELSALGYKVVVDPMFTGAWEGREREEFYSLIGIAIDATAPPRSGRTALFVDPDTGIKQKGSKQLARPSPSKPCRASCPRSKNVVATRCTTIHTRAFCSYRNMSNHFVNCVHILSRWVCLRGGCTKPAPNPFIERTPTASRGLPLMLNVLRPAV